jgi:hypothetical protein
MKQVQVFSGTQGAYVTEVPDTEFDTVIDEVALEFNRQRQKSYPSIQEQLDMQYWDSVNGTTVWADTIAAVKAANPKPE